MITKNISYTDFDGNKRNQVAYFNINDAELADLEVEVEGGFSNLMKEAIDKKESALYYKIFKIIVSKAYGIKSEDGRKLIKSKDIVDDFMQTNAYSELFYEVVNSEESATKFFEGVLSGCHFTEKIKNA